MKWWPFKTSTYDSEYERGRKEANAYWLKHDYDDCVKQTNHAECDRSFCEGVMRGFPNGWLDAMRENGVLTNV